jgi:tartrate dehydrogenase/decarboxylase/D-malate dehydrogenase
MAASMMLDHIGEREAAAKIEAAVKDVLREGKIRTPDLGGTATTDMSNAVIQKICQH